MEVCYPTPQFVNRVKDCLFKTGCHSFSFEFTGGQIDVEYNYGFSDRKKPINKQFLDNLDQYIERFNEEREHVNKICNAWIDAYPIEDDPDITAIKKVVMADCHRQTRRKFNAYNIPNTEIVGPAQHEQILQIQKKLKSNVCISFYYKYRQYRVNDLWYAVLRGHSKDTFDDAIEDEMFAKLLEFAETVDDSRGTYVSFHDQSS